MLHAPRFANQCLDLCYDRSDFIVQALFELTCMFRLVGGLVQDV